MTHKVTAANLAKSLPDLLDRVRYQREEFLIERDGELIAILAPAGPGPSNITLGELATRLGHLSLPGDGFAEDLEAAQSAQSPVQSPAWRS